MWVRCALGIPDDNHGVGDGGDGYHDGDDDDNDGDHDGDASDGESEHLMRVQLTMLVRFKMFVT